MIEDIQAAVNVDFKGSSNTLRFRLILSEKDVVEVFENRHLLRNGIGEEVLIDEPHASVNECLFHRLKPVFASDNQLTKRQDEVTLECQRAFLFGVVQIDVQRIDVIHADRRDSDDLTAKFVNQRKILSLRVADNDVIVGKQEGICHLSLRRKAFAGTGCSEDKPVWVFKKLSVYHDHVVAERIQPVIESFAALEYFLSGERNKYCRAGCGKSALDFDLIDADGE